MEAAEKTLVVFIIALYVIATPVRVSCLSENGGCLTVRTRNYVAIKNAALLGHSFMVSRNKSRLRCAKLCLSTDKCRSINHDKTSGICQLNNGRQGDFPADIRPDQSFSYFEDFGVETEPVCVTNQIGTTVDPFPLSTLATDNSVELVIIGKPTELSSTYRARTSALAVDGNLDTTSNGNCAHSGGNAEAEFDPWWKVDLEGEHCISKVSILNRGFCCSTRTTHAVVRAGSSTNVTNNMPCGSPVTAEQAEPLGGLIEISCDPPLRARYVSVDIPVVTVLNFCEVMVREVPLAQCPT